MTLLYFNIKCLFVMFLVYLSNISDRVMIYNDNMTYLFVERLVYYPDRLSGRDYVSMVLRYYLPASAIYNTGHVVDRGCDITVESFVVHSPIIDLEVDNDYKVYLVLLLIFLSNLHGM